MGALRYVTGIAFLILGVIGLFLPVLQCILFILIGLAILFPRNRYVGQLITRGRNRWPEQATRMDARKQRYGFSFRASGREV